MNDVETMALALSHISKSLADLNSVYYTPVGRTLPEDQIFKLEHFVIAKS